MLNTVFWIGATKGRAQGAPMPFPILAPAKTGTALGEHVFWRGLSPERVPQLVEHAAQLTDDFER